MTNKKLKGYIFSRPFMGERVPQHVQNIVVRDYCIKNNYSHILSATEYSIKNSHLMLNQALNEINNFDGIAAYSLFQLPEDDIKRRKIYNIILKKKKEIHFSLEQMKISTIDEMYKIEQIWSIKKALPNCPKKI